MDNIGVCFGDIQYVWFTAIGHAIDWVQQVMQYRWSELLGRTSGQYDLQYLAIVLGKVILKDVDEIASQNLKGKV